VRVRRSTIEMIDDGEEVVDVAGDTLPVAHLDDILGLARNATTNESDFVLLLLVAAAGERVAFAIDEVESEQEVLFKSLGAYLAHVPNISGATVLGSGEVVPILNAPDLVQSAVGGVRDEEAAAIVSSLALDAVKSILVAEDSITSRLLLKEILETAGYQVTTAIDGADALSRLEERSVDLVVSDVEMPKLNGFELTERIRSHPKHGGLPVILVTGLERQRDRERGIGAGASAYIVKSQFDQSALLDTIQRLI